MSELDDILELYKNSEFYKKNKNTYHSDKILKNVFKQEVKINRFVGLSKKTYEEIHQIETDLMRNLIYEFENRVDIKDKNIIYEMIHAFYVDPDGNGISNERNVLCGCGADGLFSVNRIFRKFERGEEAVAEYERYRKKPIFYFPREKNGINPTRCLVFGDRIDHTLYDLKMCLNRIEEKSDIRDCKLYSAYKRPKTSKWLKDIGSFEKLVEAYGIEGIFVNENYEVYDIERGNGEPISKYDKSYSWQWSDTYYDNLKALVDKFYAKEGINGRNEHLCHERHTRLSAVIR